MDARPGVAWSVTATSRTGLQLTPPSTERTYLLSSVLARRQDEPSRRHRHRDLPASPDVQAPLTACDDIDDVVERTIAQFRADMERIKLGRDAAMEPISADDGDRRTTTPEGGTRIARPRHADRPPSPPDMRPDVEFEGATGRLSFVTEDSARRASLPEEGRGRGLATSPDRSAMSVFTRKPAAIKL